MIDRELIYRALTGEISKEEEDIISSWHEEYPEECQKAIDEIHALIDLSSIACMEKADQKERRKRIIRKVAATAARVAAAAVLAIITGYLAHIATWDRFSSTLTSVEAPPGEQVSIILPDSTTVRLNSRAKITYPVVFSRKERSVQLQGEAMFDVRHDKDKPFIVNTFASEITVLGTKFNVNADEEADTFSTILLDGKLQIRNLASPESGKIIMHPNDIVNIRNGIMSIDKLKNQDEICWTQGLIDLRGEPFDKLMKRFERTFNVKIVIETDHLPDMSDISGKIRINDGIVNALHILQHTSGFKFRKNEDTNTITIY